MINLARVANSPAFNQRFTLHRTTGAFTEGGWAVLSRTEVPSSGVITPATDKALQQVPEGDRVVGSLQVITTHPIYTTSADINGISDTLTWSGDTYRIQSVGPWTDYGFNVAIIVRMSGE